MRTRVIVDLTQENVEYVDSLVGSTRSEIINNIIEDVRMWYNLKIEETENATEVQPDVNSSVDTTRRNCHAEETDRVPDSLQPWFRRFFFKK